MFEHWFQKYLVYLQMSPNISRLRHIMLHFTMLSFFLAITGLKKFSWRNVIQQIKKVSPNAHNRGDFKENHAYIHGLNIQIYYAIKKTKVLESELSKK